MASMMIHRFITISSPIRQVLPALELCATLTLIQITIFQLPLPLPRASRFGPLPLVPRGRSSGHNPLPHTRPHNVHGKHVRVRGRRARHKLNHCEWLPPSWDLDTWPTTEHASQVPKISGNSEKKAFHDSNVSPTAKTVVGRYGPNRAGWDR